MNCCYILFFCFPRKRRIVVFLFEIRTICMHVSLNEFIFMMNFIAILFKIIRVTTLVGSSWMQNKFRCCRTFQLLSWWINFRTVLVLLEWTIKNLEVCTKKCVRNKNEDKKQMTCSDARAFFTSFVINFVQNTLFYFNMS